MYELLANKDDRFKKSLDINVYTKLEFLQVASYLPSKQPCLLARGIFDLKQQSGVAYSVFHPLYFHRNY